MVYQNPKEAESSPVQASMAALLTQEQLLTQLALVRDESGFSAGLADITAYAGASAFLLARYDLATEQNLANIISSNWPFDIVRLIDGEILAICGRTTEIEKCTATLQPGFGLLPDGAALPENISRQHCWVDFVVGHMRYRLLFLLPENVIASAERIRQAGLLASYLMSIVVSRKTSTDRDADLTDREIECLYWIAEGKTSEEIALILGISRNTINNYITSIMRKTATRNRPEAVAYAVRNHLV
ncbi:transcriptional regulator VisN [Rhizobium sp. L1K21]|uniref:transcriptional regulator VisN n=1 Tax=Rhizobium sp. L1K21 TaxID=2954933 RepID=UPI002092A793|nr:helix-turn-helix transcriptional regulator [Rhizobium sp. L1K21]MCO6187139.1 helix-turn-helix transcriptional regulator [Rhizobium sp. L1K21]